MFKIHYSCAPLGDRAQERGWVGVCVCVCSGFTALEVRRLRTRVAWSACYVRDESQCPGEGIAYVTLGDREILTD